MLVVDDDDGVRRIMARKVEQAGYRVLTARDGLEALTLLEQGGIEVHLVVCDLLMPGSMATNSQPAWRHYLTLRKSSLCQPFAPT